MHLKQIKTYKRKIKFHYSFMAQETDTEQKECVLVIQAHNIEPLF